MSKVTSNMRKQLLSLVDLGENMQHLITAIELPTGATEIIHNTTQFQKKIDYYLTHYEDVNGRMCLKTNHDVKLVGVMAV